MLNGYWFNTLKSKVVALAPSSENVDFPYDSPWLAVILLLLVHHRVKEGGGIPHLPLSPLPFGVTHLTAFDLRPTDRDIIVVGLSLFPSVLLGSQSVASLRLIPLDAANRNNANASEDGYLSRLISSLASRPRQRPSTDTIRRAKMDRCTLCIRISPRGLLVSLLIYFCSVAATTEAGLRPTYAAQLAYALCIQPSAVAGLLSSRSASVSNRRVSGISARAVS